VSIESVVVSCYDLMKLRALRTESPVEQWRGKFYKLCSFSLFKTSPNTLPLLRCYCMWFSKRATTSTWFPWRALSKAVLFCRFSITIRWLKIYIYTYTHTDQTTNGYQNQNSVYRTCKMNIITQMKSNTSSLFQPHHLHGCSLFQVKQAATSPIRCHLQHLHK
jgi:hypothetical protein